VLVLRSLGPRVKAAPAALVLALAIPFIFLHPVYQRSVTVSDVTANFSDFAILAVVVAAIVDGVRHGFEPLRGNRSVWVPLAAFCLLILASLGWAHHADPEYGLKSHLISATKFVEYALLAPAAAVALRRDRDRRVFLWMLLLWSAFLSAVAVLQFLGVLHQFKGHRPEQREPSYIGFHDLGAFSGAALAAGFASILLGLHRRLGRIAVLSGSLGIAIAAALDSVGGMTLTAVATAALARRRAPVARSRLLSVAAICVVVAVGAVSLRSTAIKDFLRFLGVSPATKEQTRDIQTYAQRTVLSYIGLQIFIHHPVLGVGWQESSLPHSFEPHLAKARARFPKAAPQSFPSRAQEWGVQNGIVQTLADLGIVGGLVLAALVVATLMLFVRVAARGPPELVWWSLAGTGSLIFALAVFTGSGLLPAIPVDALLWLSIGIAVSLHNSLPEHR
jgi:hypothetical protein